MVLKYMSKNNFILLEGFVRVCTVSSYFPDNPRRYPTLEVRYSKILSGGNDFISLIKRLHLVVYTGQISGRLNDNFFLQN